MVSPLIVGIIAIPFAIKGLGKDGFGILLLVGPGFPMILGDGVYTATVGGIGGSVLAGIGFQPGFGGQPGFTGIGDMIT